MALAAGARLGPYVIVSALGAGGMGEVYRARDTRLDRDVAIKILPDVFARDPERLARFEREAKTLASLNHPNVGHVYGLEESRGVRALVMELVDGDDLSVLIARGPIPFADALPIAKQIADALEAAHELGVIHRDVKPANVKVRADGTVKVLDFGLAKAINPTPASNTEALNSPTLTALATELGMILGTAAYMSPEQARGKAVDRRTDIWAFGCVLYEMLTGRLAFAGETVSDTIAAILEREPDWNALPQTTPVTIRRLLHRCLDRDPKRRLRDIGDARTEIDDAIGGRPEAPAAGTTIPVAHRRQSPWIAAAAVMLVASVTLWFLWRGTAPIDRPLLRLVVDLGPEAIGGTRTTAVLSSDGTRIAFVARDSDGHPRLATRLLSQPILTFLGGTENAEDPFFSPDGQWLGFFAGGQMKKIPVLGGTPVFLCEGVANAHGATWGEDGAIILSPNPSSALHRLPSAGGPLQELKGTVNALWPQILPGGQEVLFSRLSHPDYGNIEVLSLRTGKTTVVARGFVSGRYLPSGHLVFIREHTLYGQAFDLGRLEASGVPVPLQDDVEHSDRGRFGQSLSFAGNGTLVYPSGRDGGLTTVALLDRAGKMESLLPAALAYSSPSLSPDGKYLAIDANSSPWIHDLQRNTAERIRSTRDSAAQPTWAPDAKHIVFGGNRPTGLWWSRADGAGEPVQLLVRPLFAGPSSVYGDRVAFHEPGNGTGWDIWTLQFDTSDPAHPKPGTPEPFLRSTRDEYSAKFSPDGRWIAYTSNESGDYEIAVRPFKGPGGPWQISTGAAAFERGGVAVWSRKGEALYYLSSDLQVMEVAYSVEGDAFVAAKPRRWSDTAISTRGFDVSPDGKRLVVLVPVAGQTENVHMTFLINFFDELRRRVPAGGK